jgi:16S rRNA (uracil1498-N3)-methyltransferase
MPRIYCSLPLSEGALVVLDAAASRHVQVLRAQPGDALTLFTGAGGQWQATIERMGRSEVTVRIGGFEPLEREAARPVHLACGMPANERMDWLVEKATELGAVRVQPLHTAHSVLRLSAERAAKKQQHWQQVAVAACEQCGRNRVPTIEPVRTLSAWLGSAEAQAPAAALRCVLSLAEGARPWGELLRSATPTQPVWLLSGPEGGLSAEEDAQARAYGFVPVTLGPRVLRAETAPLAALALATLG